MRFNALPSVLGAALVLALSFDSRSEPPGGPASAPTTTGPQALIGKPPPPIQIARWIKGEPLTGFEKGKVYVVDFWATWCGPCKAAIPHLTRLAHAHRGKVEVIGISISEHQDNPTDSRFIGVVEKFVQKMGDSMDYRVAVDTVDRKMHATWFKPTGTGGIPTAYIIDQNSLVAWTGIGMPADIERIVGQVLAGTFDIRQEAERERVAEAEAKKRSDADIAAAKARNPGTDQKFPGYREAMERGDTSAALASLDAAFKADPNSEIEGAYQWKLMLLLRRIKPEEVNRYARDLLARHGDNDDIMGFVSACIVSTSEDPRFDTRLALETARRADEMAKPDSRWAQFAKWRLAWAYHHVGQSDKAAASASEALEGVRRLKDRINFDNLEAECEEAVRLFGGLAK